MADEVLPVERHGQQRDFLQARLGPGLRKPRCEQCYLCQCCAVCCKGTTQKQAAVVPLLQRRQTARLDAASASPTQLCGYQPTTLRVSPLGHPCNRIVSLAGRSRSSRTRTGRKACWTATRPTARHARACFPTAAPSHTVTPFGLQRSGPSVAVLDCPPTIRRSTLAAVVDGSAVPCALRPPPPPRFPSISISIIYTSTASSTISNL